MSELKNYWISWYHEKEFSERKNDCLIPEWVTGWRVDDEAQTVCAAVKADNEDEAKEIIARSYQDRPKNIEFRFCEKCEDDWIPFNDRFRKREDMEWNNPAGE